MLITIDGKAPRVTEAAFLAVNATLIGDVSLAVGASVWFNAVLRGDVGPITIGARTNVQDHVVMHMPWGGAVEVGEDSTIGHGAIVHGCTIGSRVLVGMGAIVMDRARIADECIIAAGAVVPPNTEILPRSLVMGTPGRVARTLTDEEIDGLTQSAHNYAALAERHRVAAVPGKGM